MDAATHTRQIWSDLPENLIAEISRVIGDVVSADSQPRGFSTGIAARVSTADGGCAFVKAADRRRNEETVALHRREASILDTIPLGPVAPGLIGTAEDENWFALVIDDVEGRHPDGRPGDTERVLDALASLPRLADGHGLPIVADDEAENMTAWTSLIDASDADLPPWASAHCDALAELASGATEALRGDWLLHCDTRADNLLVEADGTVRIVDWPWATIGCRWFDALAYLIDARLRAEPIDANRLVTAHPIFAGAADDAITAVLAGLAGHFLDKARRPAPPFMPTLRAFQRAEGEAALAWVRERVEQGHTTT
ncbi:phosphotransferase [Paramicrobacterium fandaimingii]|uniref:phosphotransferase n=1 Tax=Paramicrobacterium fandaimingii TaxID=2708079 RepID=UPI001423E7E0|nr:phosphotransferase [Microbacterium fandaimingii]